MLSFSILRAVYQTIRKTLALHHVEPDDHVIEDQEFFLLFGASILKHRDNGRL